MQIINQDTISIAQIVEELKKGSVIVYPTETTYGLGCRMTDAAAVSRIFDIKQRQQEKSVLVVADDIAVIKEYVVWNPLLEDLAEKYWPGPLTIVAHVRDEKIEKLPDGVVGPQDTLAFRVTSHPLAHDIAHDLGEPLVSTSANIASMDSPYDITDVIAMFEGQEYQPDIIVDGGVLPHQPASTIVRVTDGFVEVLRQGEVIVSEQ